MSLKKHVNIDHLIVAKRFEEEMNSSMKKNVEKSLAK
jgi:hypothetical protein